MLEMFLFFFHYAIVLLFGVLLSYAYAGIHLPPHRHLSLVVTFVICGVLQLAVYDLFGEHIVWRVYPLITHLPIIAVLCICYRKRFVTSLASVTTAYLCCQPAKWAGTLVFALTQNTAIELIVRLLMLLAMGYICIHYVAPNLSKLFAKDFRSICLFGSIPVVYYLYDYITGIYGYLWISDYQTTTEFIPFILCIFFVAFCTMYYRECEKKASAEHREYLVQLAIQQQRSQIEAVKRTEKELRILRHDMRLLLSSLAVCIENNEQENAKEMIQSYISRIEETKLDHFCENDFVNCVLSDFSSKCRTAGVPFTYNVEVDTLNVDAILFCSILSNALDNALNAQQALPHNKQSIKVMLKNADGKLLLSVKNAIHKPPVFVDGLPVTNRIGHGFGTQSIRHITEALGGNCQFSAQDGIFTVRVVL